MRCGLRRGLGLEKAISGQYDLIVLDIMLPTLNGFKVCSELRKLGHGSHSDADRQGSENGMKQRVSTPEPMTT